MKHRLYTVHDKAAGSFGPPFVASSDVHAIRSFAVQVNNKDSFLNGWPQDYDLYYVGHFDDTDGTLNECPRPLSILTSATSVKREKE